MKLDGQNFKPNYLFFFFLIIYLISLSNVASLTHDSITYINEIVRGEIALHPHHLLYHVFSLAWYKIFNFTGITSNATYMISSLNAVFGAIGSVFLFQILNKNLLLSFSRSILFTLIICMSFGYWFYSINTEVYIIPLVFLLLSFKFKLHNKPWHIIAIPAAIAVLFHQIHVLFGLSFFIYMLFEKGTTRQKVQNIFNFSIVYSSIILIPYLFTLYYLELNSFQKISYWLTKYHHEVNSWNSLSISMFFKDIVGYSRALTSSFGMFQLDFIQESISRIFPGKNFDNEIYLLKHYRSSISYLYLILMLVFYSVYITFLVKLITRVKKINRELKVLLFPIIIYSLFFTFWDSANVEFWIPQITFIWILIAYTRKDKSKIAEILLLVSISFINLVWAVYPAKYITNDYYYQKVISANEVKSNSEYVILNSKWIIDEYFKKYSDIQTKELNSISNDSIDYYLNNALISPKVYEQMKIDSSLFIKLDSKEFIWYKKNTSD